jgi:hypothetical protein
MSIGSKVEAVRAAEAEVVLQHQRLLAHLHEFREVREGLVTPGRIVTTGLAVGFVVGHAVPTLRSPTARHDIKEGADVLQQVLRVVSAAMPVLVPLWQHLRGNGDTPEQASEAGYGVSTPPH